MTLRLIRCLLLVAALGLGAVTEGLAQPSPPPGDAPRRLVLEAVEIEGNHRTDDETIKERVPLRVGEELHPEMLLEAADALRAGGLFREVRVHARPGSRPGRIVAVFQVEEKRPTVELGAGYEDLSGWYLIPARLNLDNLTGRGESFTLGTRFGYRVRTLMLEYRSVPEHVRQRYWGARLRLGSQDRIYYSQGAELNHEVPRGGLDLLVGAPLGRRLSLEARVSFEGVDPDSHATFYQDREILGRSQGDPVPFASLPAEIQDDLGRREQTRLALSLAADARRGRGLAQHGVRGRVQTEGVLSATHDFVSVTADVRGYQPLRPGLLLAGRLRGGVLTSAAPFYERFYLGGLYTVRGFPSQSLSPPQGDTRLISASVELRSAWIGPADNPRLTGLLFLDVGAAGGDAAAPSRDDVSVGVGYGARLRVPWVQSLGLDVGLPLTDSPARDSFHVNVSLGWTY